MAETKWPAPASKVLSSYKDRALQKENSGKDSPNKFSHVSLFYFGFPKIGIFSVVYAPTVWCKGEAIGWKKLEVTSTDGATNFSESTSVVKLYPYKGGK